MWAPGTLVVCINDRIDLAAALSGEPWLLRAGSIYTVRNSGHTRGEDWVMLAEIARAPVPLRTVGYSGEAPFRALRFRPVSEAHRKIVRDLLAPVPPVEEEIARAVREEVGGA